MPLQIIKKDITTMDCDIIVNPTDREYSGSGGTDYAIHKAAGKELDFACEKLPPNNVGEVEYTNAFNLKSKYIIHTVGPTWNGGGYNEEMSLRSCYMNSLVLAVKLRTNSIAFPLISSGTFGFPKDRVLRIAIDTISDFFSVTDYELDVTICVIDKNAYELSREVDLKEYLDNEQSRNLISESIEELDGSMPCDCYMLPDDYSKSKCLTPEAERNISYSRPAQPLCEKIVSPNKDSLEDWIDKTIKGNDGFSITLLKLIDQRGMTDVECYKRANISKQTFWKIMNDKNYNPNKKTVISFAISLRLTLSETETLLKTVGYSFSHSNKFDLIIEFFIKNEVYDIYEINSALYKYDQVTLGC